MTWTTPLELNERREPISGSPEALREAIRRGADLRVYTEFRYNEHIDTKSCNTEIVKEVSEFRCTYLVEDRWVAGIMTQRQPVEPFDKFGPRPSMSFFMYNENGQQAIARPYLDGRDLGSPVDGKDPNKHIDMPKYHLDSQHDLSSNAPSQNFVYDFEVYRFRVRDEWEEVLSHDKYGNVLSGSTDALVEAFTKGRELKVSIRDVAEQLTDNPDDARSHEMFVHTNSAYYATETGYLLAATHPFVRVKPGIPMEYVSEGWDFGWAVVRTDGLATLRITDPYSLSFQDSSTRFAIRWFVN